MSDKHATRSFEKLKELADLTDDPNVKRAIEELRESIHLGHIRSSMGAAIGRNIRLIVDQLNLPGEAVGALLNVRNQMFADMGLDPGRYQVSLIADKTRGFVGRDYVFQAIEKFLQSQESGYFAIEADPGLGKSAILAEYVRRTGCIAHFNVRATGINSAKKFLENVCAQIIVDFGLPYPTLPADAGQDSAFLSRILEEGAQKLSAGERLVIAVDALDEVELSGHQAGANILFLPAILPKHVYFILTRRDKNMPFVVQAPQRNLDLMHFPGENRKDIELFLAQSSERGAVSTWIERRGMSAQAFIAKMADLSENNFMYLRYVLPEIECGRFQDLDIQKIPAGLNGYYEDHWQQMGMTTKPLPRVKIRIIYIMCEARQPVSRELIAEFASDEAMQVDQLTVQEVLDAWGQFLHEQQAQGRSLYSLYHASFRDFLHRKEIVQAAGTTIKDVNGLIAENLWRALFASDEHESESHAQSVSEENTPTPKVFISYSHDSEAHGNRVLELSDKLRGHGVDCHIDLYEESPPEGWPRWCDKHVREADFVLVACTETYLRRFRGEEKGGKGLGGAWEGHIITQELYNAQGSNTKFLPIIFGREDTKFIPTPLQSATHYRVPLQYDELYRRLTGQPKIIRPKLGDLKAMPPRQMPALPELKPRRNIFVPLAEKFSHEETIRSGGERLYSELIAENFISHSVTGTPTVRELIDEIASHSTQPIPIESITATFGEKPSLRGHTFFGNPGDYLEQILGNQSGVRWWISSRGLNVHLETGDARASERPQEWTEPKTGDMSNEKSAALDSLYNRIESVAYSMRGTTTRLMADRSIPSVIVAVPGSERVPTLVAEMPDRFQVEFAPLYPLNIGNVLSVRAKRIHYGSRKTDWQFNFGSDSWHRTQAPLTDDEIRACLTPEGPRPAF